MDNSSMEDPSTSRGRRLVSALSYVVPPILALFLAGIVWEIWVRVSDVPIYLVPPPSEVLKQLFWEFDFFIKEGSVTLFEALVGFSIGAGVALTGAALMAHSRFLERSLLPLAILVKVTPVVAVAPLFVIWFGFGPVPNQ